VGSDPDKRLFVPRDPTGTGVLVLAGSSGRVDEDRAQLLSDHGALALAIRWFGGAGQQPGPFEVPLESFGAALDRLGRDSDRLAIVGTSFGAEAALLTGSRDQRVAAVVAFAPSPVVWGGWTGTRWTSHWTAAGKPLSYVPFIDGWEPSTAPASYTDLYRLSLEAADAAAAESAAIPVQSIAGELVLVAGGDDRVWPSTEFAARIAARREAHGLTTVVVTNSNAGHRTVLPGEPVVSGGQSMARGGSEKADAELGEQAWPQIVTALRLRDPGSVR
jgi:hypothetical protein